MKTKKGRIGKSLLSMLVLMLCVISVTSIAYASSSYTFAAKMEYRYLDGKSNGVTYSIGKDEDITVTGFVKCYAYHYADHEGVIGGTLCAAQPTYIYLCESNFFGFRKTIAGTTVTVSAVDGVEDFTFSGTSTTTSNKYMYIYKPLNDGRDVVITGTISY